MASKGNAAAVQGTNDSSIVSKHAMVEAGYAHDPFLRVFTQKNAPRRAPLINRGYYIRTMAIESVLRDFLLTDGDKQILSLGAGFDTTYFRLSACDNITSAMKNVYYVEVDFPEVAERKKDLLSFSGLCDEMSNTDCYCLLGADLGDLTSLENLLTEHTKLVQDLPTLILSECVMTYMEHRLSTDLIRFCCAYFSNSLFVTYEQVQPSDAFGQFMRSHFDKLNSSLKGICLYSDKEKQVDRYVSCGYSKVDAFTMKEFCDSLPLTEKRRIRQLEYFDEYEEWHMKCFHYVLVLARSHCNVSPQLELRLPSIHQYTTGCDMAPLLPTAHVISDSSLPTAHVTSGSPQFAHSSCIVSVEGCRTALLSHGGFGIQDGRHCRQTLIRVYILNEKGGVYKELQFSDVLPCRLHHTLTAVNSSTVFVFGGRLSPAKPLAEPAFLRLTSDCAGDLLVDVEMISGKRADEPEPRWRHAASSLSIDGDDFVLIAGGVTAHNKSRAPTLLASCHLFNVKKLSWSCLPDYPYAVHSHSVCYDGCRYVYCVGGLGEDETALSDCYKLDLNLSSQGWSKVALPLDGIYSHNVHMLGDAMVVVGGVGSAGQQMHLKIVKLSALSVQSIALPVSLDSSLRMYFNHNSHIIRDECGRGLLFIVGGGGNCFSFGTHINSVLVCHAIHCL